MSQPNLPAVRPGPQPSEPEPAAAVPALYSPLYDPSSAVDAYWTNLDLSSPTVKSWVLGALNGAVDTVESRINETIDLYGVIAHPVEMERDGEIIQATRTIIVDPDAKAYQCVSSGIVRSLRRLMAPEMYGRGPWYPPIRCRIKQVPIAGGKRMFLLVPEQAAPVFFRPPEGAGRKGGVK